MGKQQVVKGSTSYSMPIFIQDNSVVTGAGLIGLLYNSAGLTWYYHRQGAGTEVAVTLVTATLGTFASGGFVEIDAINMPGFYEIGIPDAALADGASHVSMLLKGATNMVPIPIEIELIGENNRGYSGLKKNRAFTAMPFVMLDDAERLPAPSLTVTVQRLIDNGSLGAGTLSGVTDEGSGLYTVDGAAADANGNYVTFVCTAPGAIATIFTMVTVP